MNSLTIYCCEYPKCSYSSTSRKECFAHEAQHFRLTVEEFEEWGQLHRQAAHAGYVVGTTANPETRKAFHDAIDKLIQFERIHDLPDVHLSHFG